MAAKIQKEKDEEAAKAASSATTPTSHTKEIKKTPVSRPAVVPNQQEVVHYDAEEARKLRALSDKIDDCIARASRVEQHWNTNIQTILKLLGHDSLQERKSYV